MNQTTRKIKILPDKFPEPWAGDWGLDLYGPFMTLIYKKTRQCFRWMEPDTFMIGSPEDEPQRYEDELLHKVTLTRGFWLADTACTQELWQAVMGENPADFKGPLRPVENVSWNDCSEFIEKLNRLVPGLDSRLPTEAEWEYACRAGTRTPFHFGENITTELVNYDGTVPYTGGKKGKYRKETVEVKALPCNDWGLYQMHGNVWEWCSDWYGNYDSVEQIDPEGPPNGDYRVLRGGCWIFSGRYVRSAYRDCYAPSSRGPLRGLRLAQGQKGQAGKAGKDGG